MNRFFFTKISLLICVLVPVSVATAQNITVTEINPTHSNGVVTTSGGRINQLGRATDRIFYAASEFGGLFKTTDAGRTWTRLDHHLPTRVSDVKASPANPDIVIATSLYDGRVNSLAGINVSTDGGAHWSKPISSNPRAGFCNIPVNSSQPSAFAISFDPRNPTRVLVGTNCGLAKSVDSGTTWTFVNTSPDTLATDVYGVVVHHGGIIDTCGSSGHRRSIDGGLFWTGARNGGSPLPSGTCSITASPDESSVLFATVGTKIFETDNGGDSWDKTYVNRSANGRGPFVVTHNRAGRDFDLWFGDRSLFRAACKTPLIPGPAARCPSADSWVKVSANSHSDMGGIAFSEPPVINVTACHQQCAAAATECDNECQATFDSCMADVGKPGGPLKSQCVSQFANCPLKCAKDSETCNSNCNRPPKEGCPVVLATDGGTHFNALNESPACQTPKWTQPHVTTRALWLWSLSGADMPQSLVGEALYMGTQDNGLFATVNADAGVPQWTRLDGGDVSDTVPDTNRIIYTHCPDCGLYKTRIRLRPAGSGGSSEIPNYPPGLIPRFLFAEVVARFGPKSYVVYSMFGPGRGNVFATTDITQNPIVWKQLGVFLGNACGLWAAGPPTNPTFYTVSGSGIICTDLISGSRMPAGSAGTKAPRLLGLGKTSRCLTLQTRVFSRSISEIPSAYSLVRRRNLEYQSPEELTCCVPTTAALTGSPILYWTD